MLYCKYSDTPPVFGTDSSISNKEYSITLNRECLIKADVNSADPDQTAPKEQSDPGLYCLPR